MLKLGGYVQSYKNLAQVRMSRSKVKGEGHGDKKNEKVRHFVLESSSGAAVLGGAATPVGKSAHAV